MSLAMEVHFCDPAIPWLRSSADTSSLSRYLPGTDLFGHILEDLEHTARQLYWRQRKTFSWETPAERLRDYFGLPLPFQQKRL
jgi:IS30 family transposase